MGKGCQNGAGGSSAASNVLDVPFGGATGSFQMTIVGARETDRHSILVFDRAGGGRVLVRALPLAREPHGVRRVARALDGRRFPAVPDPLERIKHLRFRQRAEDGR